MRRSLKSQIQKDAKRVFLNLGEFAVEKEIVYYQDGMNRPPRTLKIPVSIDEDANMNSVWNKNKNQQRIGNDQELYQMEIVFFCALEDFQPPPKKARRIQVDDLLYEVLSVKTIEGMLEVELRRLEE